MCGNRRLYTSRRPARTLRARNPTERPLPQTPKELRQVIKYEKKMYMYGESRNKQGPSAVFSPIGQT